MAKKSYTLGEGCDCGGGIMSEKNTQDNENIEQMVLDAQSDRRKLGRLIEDFLPFIRSVVADCHVGRQSREDAMTTAMLAFADSVAAYRPEKGAFVGFARVLIRNRLIDEYRKHHRRTALDSPILDENGWETGLSVKEHNYQLEQSNLRMEIEEITDILGAWGITFAELTDISPKQRRTRWQCQYIAALILKNQAWQKQLFINRRLPSKEMCKAHGVSLKTLDKYRKYIITLCIIMAGDFPHLRAFLPMSRGEAGSDE
jgi:RNA polymerase sigma factor